MVETTYQPAKIVEFDDDAESEQESELEPFYGSEFDEETYDDDGSELGEVSSCEDWQPDFDLDEDEKHDDNGSELGEVSSCEDWQPDFQLVEETPTDDQFAEIEKYKNLFNSIFLQKFNK